MKIIFRLDDFSNSRHSKNWRRAIELFEKHDVQACIGVIAKCEDPKLIFDEQSSEIQFWTDVRSLKELGHTIALHGYKHVYHACKRSESIIPIHNFSEFSGLDLLVQEKKISESIKIFSQHGVVPEVFMAPAHSFDLDTIIALKKQTKIRYITDGSTSDCFNFKEINFIPQQFGSLRRPFFKLNCYCLHPNTMTTSDFTQLEEFLYLYKEYIVPFSIFKTKTFPPLNYKECIIIKTFNLFRYFKRLVS